MHNPAKFRTATSRNPAVEFLPLQPPTTVWPGKTNYSARIEGKSAIFHSIIRQKELSVSCYLAETGHGILTFFTWESLKGSARDPIRDGDLPGQLSQRQGFDSFVLYRNETVPQMMAHLCDTG